MTPETGGIDYQWWGLFFQALGVFVSGLTPIMVFHGIRSMTRASKFRNKEIDKQTEALKGLIEQSKEQTAALVKVVEAQDKKFDEIIKQGKEESARRDRDAEASRKALETQTAALARLLQTP